jgi:hypothetical protein
MTEYPHLRKGVWTCPYCDATKESVHVVSVINSTLRGSLKAHVRHKKGSGHGPWGELPPTFTPTVIEEHVSVSKCERVENPGVDL